jgi:hypothetical protein
MNTTGYATERRPCMSAGELVSLFGIPHEGYPTPEAIALFAELFEGMDDDTLVGFVVDCGELAGELHQPPEVRRLAAALASCAESAVVTGLTDWDAVFDLLDAGKAASHTERNL